MNAISMSKKSIKCQELNSKLIQNCNIALVVKILYITYDGLTDALGQSQILPYLIGCSRKHKIHILSFEKKVQFEKRADKIRQITENHGISWKNIIYTKNPPILSTFTDIGKMNRAADEMIRNFNIDVVHCRSYIAAYIGFNLKKRNAVKVLFDMRGFWADERMDGRIWNKWNPIHIFLYKALKKAEKKWLVEADGIISLTASGKKEILDHIQPSAKSDKITVIPCCTDESIFNPDQIPTSKKEEYRKLLGLRNTETALCYLGSIGTWYLLDGMLEQFRTLYSMNKVDKFILITSKNESLIENRAMTLKVPMNNIVVTSCERYEVPYYLSAVDVGICYIINAFSKKASSPTKIGEFLLMGKPVICNPIGDLQEIFSQSAFGICHAPGQRISEDEFDKLISLPSSQIRENALSLFSLQNGISEYLQVYKSLDENT